MSFKNPKNLIAVVSVIVALIAATVLLGGYANSKPAEATYDAPIKACQGGMVGCCPMMVGSAMSQKLMAAEGDTAGCSSTPCTTGCPKPCCAGENAEGCCDNPCPIPCPKPCCVGENAEGCCDNPCPFPCPKPCCVEDGPMGCCGTAGAAGCPMTALETAAE